MLIHILGANNYWCWSRRDFSDSDLKKIPITRSVNDDIVTEKLTITFENNATHIRCNGKWPREWMGLHQLHSMPCETSTFPIAYVDWKNNIVNG